MNTEKTLDTIYSYYGKRNKIKEEMRVEIQEHFGDVNSESLKKLCADAISEKDKEKVNCLVELSHAFHYSKYILSCWNQLLLEPWHQKYEDIIHIIQNIANPESIPFIEKAMQQKYDFLEFYGTGTGQFISQCGHALWSIDTKEAIDVVKRMSKSKDPLIKDIMLYRLSRIEAWETPHQRNFNL